MLTQDIDSQEPRTTRLMTVDVVQRFREEWNRSKGTINQYYLDIPFPEEFVRSPHQKYIRILTL